MRTHTAWYLAAGAGAGMLAGFLGIGGGIILVPMMTGLLCLSQHRAHGTSLAVILPIAAVGTVVYATRGDIDWPLAATIGVGSVAGAVVGARLMMRLSAHRLQQAFGLYAIAVAILLILR